MKTLLIIIGLIIMGCVIWVAKRIFDNDTHDDEWDWRRWR